MSSQNNVMESILGNNRTVFTTQYLRMITGQQDTVRLTKSMHYYVKKGKINNPRRGIYTKSHYEETEMACSLFRPSYISMEYVLQRSGVIFQYDDRVTCISYLNREVEIDDKVYSFRIIKPEIWVGLEGIEQRENVCMASPERAFLDMVYLSAGFCYFDNLNPLNKTKIKELLPLYNSQVLTRRVYELMQIKTKQT